MHFTGFLQNYELPLAFQNARKTDFPAASMDKNLYIQKT